ncbi:hypothetical protein [Kitasatospora camelliae]|uniref:Basic secretory peptidase family protein n=1 Tax=Kitasatospora camelliae TaxID=3156397 RepID=A0AAU8JTH1_9ACTN
MDTYPVRLNRRLGLVRDPAGGWLLSEDQPVGPAALWDLAPVRVARGERCLVLGAGDEATLGGLAALADRAVPAVEAVWGPAAGGSAGGAGVGAGAGAAGSGGRLVLELPATLEEFARLLDVPAENYRGIAAVTVAAGGAPVRTPADRIQVNPDAYRGLSELGRRVVITHEATHVATRADTKGWTPLWLSEGVADYTGYRGSGRTGRQIAPGLTREVVAGRLPGGLPTDADFAAGAGGIALAYELSWLLCDLLARTFGPDRLVGFYRAVAAAGNPGDGREARDALVARLVKEWFGLDQPAFTHLWTTEAGRLGE